MASMAFMFAIFLRIFWIWILVSADGEIFQSSVMLTWNESHKYCEDIGKVLFDAKIDDFEVSMRKILKDTNQAWVSARVEFRHFVNVPVCMATIKHFAPNKSFETDVVYNCLNFSNSHLYAGLKDRDCYCFKDLSTLTRSMSCNYTCNNDPFHQCGGNQSISVYEKVDKVITQHIVHGCKECVYSRTTLGVVELFTESCVGHGAQGAICEAGKDAGCRDNDWTVAREQLCRIDRVDSLKWKQANQYCVDIGGHLVTSRIQTMIMLDNLTYWLGLYRIPMIHRVNALELVTKDTYCAVARGEADLVLIEGDDCRAKHAIICQDDSLERSSVSPQSTKKPIPGERCNSEPNDDKSIYGLVAVTSMLLVALVITALVIIFRRRQVSQESVNISATHSTRDQYAVQKRNIISPLYEPLRHIQTENENLQSSYLTVIFDRGMQDVAI